MRRATLAIAGVAVLLQACAAGPPRPVTFDAANEPCRYCRMVGSSGRFAAQVVAPGQDPIFFDDIGCLRDFLAGDPPLANGALAFVVDHRTRDWIRVSAAVYTAQPGIETPMGSHLLAHDSTASRDADPDARGGRPISIETLFSESAEREAARP